MNFEQLQSTWSSQPPSAPSGRELDLARLTRVLVPEINRRRRFLGYSIFVLIVGLVVTPLLTVVNFRYAPPAHPVWYWTYFATWMVLLLASLVVVLRALERHGAIRAQSTRSVRDLALATLASLEAEMRSCRGARWLVPPIVLFQLAHLFVNFPPSVVGWAPFLHRAAFVVGLPIVLGLGFRRHYLEHLAPARERQQQLLRELT